MVLPQISLQEHQNILDELKGELVGKRSTPVYVPDPSTIPGELTDTTRVLNKKK